MNKFWSLFTVTMLIIISWSSVRIVEAYQFDKNAGGHLKRAANANTVEMASNELKTALNYLEENSLTSGSTYILFDTPNKDIGYWYDNIKSSQEELEKVTKDASQLETSNLLMKLRETLTDQNSDGGTSIIVPPGISISPHNLLFALWGWLGFILFLIWSGIGIKRLIEY